MISHEMSTPLATIIFFLDFIFNFLNGHEESGKSSKMIETDRMRAIKYTTLI